jgi:sensor histidine kinase YesM
MKPSSHRRIILIDTPFQLRMAGGFLLLQLALTGVFTVVLYLFMDSELKVGLASAHAAYRSLDQMLLPIVTVIAGFNLLLSIVVITSFVVILSHRIAGPLYRFRAILENLAQRRISAHTHLRPKDQLEAVSQAMTLALATLTTDLDGLSAATKALRQALANQDLASAERHAAELERLLGAWQPPSEPA